MVECFYCQKNLLSNNARVKLKPTNLSGNSKDDQSKDTMNMITRMVIVLSLFATLS